MQIPMSFLILLFFSILIKAKQTKNTVYLPLVHVKKANYFDDKVLSPPLLSPGANKGLAFMAQIYFGSPSVIQYLHVDTGSNLTWTQCFPCSHCFADHIYPKYWPEDSTTYREAFCETTTNDTNPRFSYSYSSGICYYELSYEDENGLRGTLSEETITMQTLDGGFKEVHDVYFGCNDQAVGDNFIGMGILGLGFGNYSLVQKFDSKFSICFGRISESTPSHNLIFGDGAVMQGHPTIVDITNGDYMFQLESILVGEKKTLDNPIQVYLDTGTFISHFSPGLHKLIVDKVTELIGGDRFTSVRYSSLLCYVVEAQEIPDQIDITFVFAGGAELRMDVRSLFLPNGSPGTLCLAINKNINNKQRIIIGAVAMQGYNFGYDLKEEAVYFQKQNCNM